MFKNGRICWHFDTGRPAGVVTELHAVPLANSQQVQSALAICKPQVVANGAGRHAHTEVQYVGRRITRHALDFLKHAGQWRVNEKLVVHGNYSWMRVDVHANPVSLGNATSDETSHPQNTAHLRFNYNASETVELDTMLFYVDRISFHNIDSYIRWDARVGFQLTEQTNASLVVQNILDSHRPEYGPQFTQQASEVERAFYFLMTSRF